MNLLLLQYNNYYNRIIEKEDSTDSYRLNSEHYLDLGNINFIPNDGVNTEQIINWNQDWNPDYLVVYTSGQTPQSDEIESRWFIIESVRTRNGQFKLTLHRDIVSDNMEAALGATMYIEKATIQTSDDVAIYNKENLELNSIKTDEILLKDETNIPWIVGYIDSDTSEEDITIPSPDIDHISATSFDSWDYKDYVTSDYNYVYNYSLEARFSLFPKGLMFKGAGRVTIDGNYEVITDNINTYCGRYSGVPKGNDAREAWLSPLARYFKNHKTFVENILNTYYNYKFDNNIIKLKDQYIYFDEDSDTYPAGYYKINVSYVNAKDEGWYDRGSELEVRLNQNLFANYTTGFEYIPELPEGDPAKNIYGTIYYSKYRLSLTPVSASELTVSIPAGHKKLSDAPYDMFCIPADTITVIKTGGNFDTISRIEALNVATKIAAKLDTRCYDLQLLPYCPMIKGVDEDGIDVTELEASEYSYIKNEDNDNVGIILFASNSSKHLELHYPLAYPSTIEDLKVANQADMYRICSPNYSASFDFNVVKTGVINNWNIDFTYKPYSPYIRVVPQWGKLYGTDFRDARGLICQGDFSIPMMNDKWESYQLNNKNYLNAFNRQVESIELKNKWAKAEDIFGALSGTVQGTITGAKAGIGGAIAGGATSAIGGALDVAEGAILRNDALDLTKDQFNFSLQNIQALPQTIAKVSSYDINNKIFPFIEYYTCTNEEKDILKDKMNYDGMTIMRIGNIAEFLDGSTKHYVKGQLIRCEDIGDDFHLLKALADELYKGVYI